MRIIINGDDFGFSEGQNLGIIKAHKEGILTSTTAMAGGPALSHGMALAKECPDLSIGVHLTLDALRPLSPLDRIPSLVDEHGKFVRFPMAPLFLSRWKRCIWSGQLKLKKSDLTEMNPLIWTDIIICISIRMC